MTDFNLVRFLLGASAALLVGISKTAVPGAAIPAVAVMAAAFPEDTKLSVGALLPVLILGDLFAIAYYRRHADWNRLVALCPYVVLGMVPGFLVLKHADESMLSVLLGVLVLLLLGLHVGQQKLGWKSMSDHWWFTAAAGVLAGFGTAMGNAAGPVMSIYLVGSRLDKHEFLGTAAWFFFLVNVSKIPWFLHIPVITRETLQFDLMIAPLLVVGALAGVIVLKRMPQVVFDTLVLGLAAVAAVRLILF